MKYYDPVKLERLYYDFTNVIEINEKFKVDLEKQIRKNKEQEENFNVKKYEYK